MVPGDRCAVLHVSPARSLCPPTISFYACLTPAPVHVGRRLSFGTDRQAGTTLSKGPELCLFTDVREIPHHCRNSRTERLREAEHDLGQRVGWPRPSSYPQSVLRLCVGSIVTRSGLVPSPLDLCSKIPRRDFGDGHVPYHGNRDDSSQPPAFKTLRQPHRLVRARRTRPKPKSTPCPLEGEEPHRGDR